MPLAWAEGAKEDAAGLKIEPVTDPAENSPKEALRLELFKEAPKKAGCLAIRTGPGGKTRLDESLDGFLNELVTAIKKGDDLRLQPLFHRRMNVSLAAIGEIYAKLANVYGPPIDLSVKQLWALNTVDGTPVDLDCADGAQAVKIRTMYGYPLQFGAWLQVMGQKELGLIYVGIVPAEGRWNLGSFNAQQWTHDGRDHAAWAKIAAKDAAKGRKQSAYAKYDLAAKLLDGGSYLAVDGRDELLKARDAVMSTADWDKSIRAALKDHDVIYTSTLFVIGGAGILARVRTPEEISVERLKIRCKQMATAVMAQSWSAGLQGMRCGFNMPSEDAAKDGALGGLYIAFDELRPKK